MGMLTGTHENQEAVKQLLEGRNLRVPKTPPTDNVEEIAEYLFDVVQGLVIAGRAHPKELQMVLYLLEMAAMEAEQVRQEAKRKRSVQSPESNK